MMEGLETVGTTEVVTDGRSFEWWYSPALDINLRMAGNYPLTGVKTERKLEHVVLGEPDGKLFEVPDGYKDVTEYQRRRAQARALNESCYPGEAMRGPEAPAFARNYDPFGVTVYWTGRGCRRGCGWGRSA